MRVSTSVLALLTTIVLARLLGIREYGLYVYAIAWARVLAIPATLGQDRLLVREVAVYQAQGQWGRLRGLLRWSTGAGTLAGLAAAAAGTLLFALGGFVRPPQAAALFAVLALVPAIGLVRLSQGALQGLRRVVAGQLPDSLIRPLVLLAAALAAGAALGAAFRAWHAVVLTVAATLAALLWSRRALHRALPGDVRAAPAETDGAAWLRSGLPLLVLAGLGVVAAQLDVLMLGWLRGSAEAAVFRVADRGAGLVGFFTSVLGLAVAPVLARLHAEQRHEDLQRLVTRSARAILVFAIPVAAVIALAAPWFLALFGREFLAGSRVLAILVLAQLANAFAGLVTQVLIMTGHERLVVRAVALGTAVNAVANVVLIPRWGAAGAAAATLAGMVAGKAALVLAARRATGLSTTGLAPLAA